MTEPIISPDQSTADDAEKSLAADALTVLTYHGLMEITAHGQRSPHEGVIIHLAYLTDDIDDVTSFGEYHPLSLQDALHQAAEAIRAHHAASQGQSNANQPSLFSEETVAP